MDLFPLQVLPHTPSQSSILRRSLQSISLFLSRIMPFFRRGKSQGSDCSCCRTEIPFEMDGVSLLSAQQLNVSDAQTTLKIGASSRVVMQLVSREKKA